MAKTYPIDVSVPAGSRDPKLGDNDIRDFKNSIRELLGVCLNIESSGNVYNSGDNEGKIAQAILRVRATDPSAVSGDGVLYTKDAGSLAIELYYLDAAGNVIQATKAGKILLTKNIIAHGSGIVSENFSGDSTVVLIKASGIDASGSDIVLLANKPRAGTATYSGDNALTLVTLGYLQSFGGGLIDSVSGVTDINTASTDYVDMTNMEITLTGVDASADVLFQFAAPFRSASAGQNVIVKLQVDDGGGSYADAIEMPLGCPNGGASDRYPLTLVHLAKAVAGGTVRGKIQWKASAGTKYQDGATYKRTLVATIYRKG